MGRDVDFVVLRAKTNLDRQIGNCRPRLCPFEGCNFQRADIPIGISRDSADGMDKSAALQYGLPGRRAVYDFSVLGPELGIPLPTTGRRWPATDLHGGRRVSARRTDYFDAYRSDHGCWDSSRIWQIPMDAVHGLLGYIPIRRCLSLHDELRHNYDFWINLDMQTRPFICDYFLYDFFGEYTDEARKAVLLDSGYGRCSLRPEFNTPAQRWPTTLPQRRKNDKNNRLLQCSGWPD